MRMRKLTPKTQHGYIRCVRAFANYLGYSPDAATEEELRRYKLPSYAFFLEKGNACCLRNPLGM